MTISYNWLCAYLPADLTPPNPAGLAEILTSVGLEVESLEPYESVKGSLEGLLIGEVRSCEPHPNADKLKIARVFTGAEELEIVCGAPNVAVGQKVVVAPVGVTIHPVTGEAVTMKTAKIRGIESQGMICAADEIGLGKDHSGILVLPAEAPVGLAAASWFEPYQDYVITIGLTPNHMDAMSHIGVAREVCAYLSHREGKSYEVKYPTLEHLPVGKQEGPIRITLENSRDCRRYSGLTIEGIHLKESPHWMQNRLRAIGVKPISNMVDITNYVLHEFGQPLHAFDADKILGGRIIVRNLPAGTKFLTLDKKEITLASDDLMICNEQEGMCLAGVYGGWETGIGPATHNVFLESAWFNPEAVRRTSFRHGLRTEAAMHFEKGMDISNTVKALQRAAHLVSEIAGGTLHAFIADVYPNPSPQKEVGLSQAYLKKLSGKSYPTEKVRGILGSLGFEILSSTGEEMRVSVPYHKPDVSLPADLVEEIMRIDGYDNVPIPGSILVSPAVESAKTTAAYRQKLAAFLLSQGFFEILTNSITNSAYFTAEELSTGIRMINNLSAELDIMRPSMLETGLESLAYNLNRRMEDLRLFEFGKTYDSKKVGAYGEKNHLALYFTGQTAAASWKGKAQPSDLYYAKGICHSVFELLGLEGITYSDISEPKFEYGLLAEREGKRMGWMGKVDSSILRRFDIRQPVFFADLDWDLLTQAAENKTEFRELPKQLAVYRDLALVLDRNVHFRQVDETLEKMGLEKLRKIELFDIFESEKLGSGKKSYAIRLHFLDEEKTLTDKEVDSMMARIMGRLEQLLGAEIRK